MAVDGLRVGRGGKVGDFPAKGPAYEEFMRLDGTLERRIMINVISEPSASSA